MGCVVNGPGEARHADLGIAAGKTSRPSLHHGSDRSRRARGRDGRRAGRRGEQDHRRRRRGATARARRLGRSRSRGRPRRRCSTTEAPTSITPKSASRRFVGASRAERASIGLSPLQRSIVASQSVLTPQEQDFPRWYQDVVAKAEMADNGPVRGTMVIRPYGYAIWERMQSEIDTRIKAAGREERLLPALHPRELLLAGGRARRGLQPRASRRHARGGEELAEPIVVRPTSETVIGEFMAKWIQSYRDLPLLLNQWCERRSLGAAPSALPTRHRVPLAGGPHRARELRRRVGLRAQGSITRSTTTSW